MFSNLDVQQRYVLFAVDFEGESHIEQSGSWWCVMYAIALIAKHPRIYRETIHSLSLYEHIGYHVLNQ